MLLAFFNVFSGLAFSYNSNFQNLDSRDYDYLQEEQNTNAHFFEEIVSTTSLPFNKKSPSNLGGYFSEVGFNFSAASQDSYLGYASYLQDKRRDLENQIFPFHFFW